MRTTTIQHYDSKSSNTTTSENEEVNDIDEIKLLELDSNAWIEMMYRTKRVRQGAYVIRVQEKDIDFIQ